MYTCKLSYITLHVSIKPKGHNSKSVHLNMNMIALKLCEKQNYYILLLMVFQELLIIILNSFFPTQDNIWKWKEGTQ